MNFSIEVYTQRINYWIKHRNARNVELSTTFFKYLTCLFIN